MGEERFHVRASIHILFLKDDYVLMLLRKNISLDGLYSLVAGHLDEGESVVEAFLREAKEEVGVGLRATDLDICTVCHSYHDHMNKAYIQFYALCYNWPGELTNQEPDKCGEIRFFSVNALPGNTVPYIRDAIPKVLKRIPFYEYGWDHRPKA